MGLGLESFVNGLALPRNANNCSLGLMFLVAFPPFPYPGHTIPEVLLIDVKLLHQADNVLVLEPQLLVLRIHHKLLVILVKVADEVVGFSKPLNVI